MQLQIVQQCLFNLSLHKTVDVLRIGLVHAVETATKGREGPIGWRYIVDLTTRTRPTNTAT